MFDWLASILQRHGDRHAIMNLRKVKGQPHASMIWFATRGLLNFGVSLVRADWEPKEPINATSDGNAVSCWWMTLMSAPL